MPEVLLIPATILPSNTVFVRRHKPKPVKDYASFRACLRWDFGFTCAICMLHERDIMDCGIEGWGVMTIEHMVPRAQDPSLLGTYANLLYICRLCNIARSDTDVVDMNGRRLLDPTKDVWSEHFRVLNDQLQPLDGDAEYTADVYRVNEARRVKLRRRRRERTVAWESLFQQGSATLDALETLYPRQWIPDDHPRDCRCRGRSIRCLPDAYLDQAVLFSRP